MSDYAVFVIGAGASKPFELPTGQELVDLVVAGRRWVPPSRRTRPLIPVDDWDDDEREFAEMPIINFANKLRSAGTNSIDRFVYYHKDCADLARVQIANILVPLESAAASEGKLLGNWHRWFINNILDRYEHPEEMPIRFISFNYDRLFEYAVASYLVCTRGMSPGIALDAASQMVRHVYGELAREPRWDAKESKYVLDSSDDTILSAANGIRLVPEDRDTDEAWLAQIRESLYGARSVVFLGFGFDELNCMRLGIGPNCPEWKPCKSRHLWTTAFGLFARERKMVERVLGSQGLIVGERREGCLEFLREHVDLDALGLGN